MEPRDRYRERHWRGHSGLVPGIILVAIGAIFLLQNLQITYVRDWIRFWPAILVAIGIVKLVDSPFAAGRTIGGVLIAIGGILLAQTLGYLDGLEAHDLWPLILIGLGVLLLVQRTWDWRDNWGDRVVTAGRLNATAVFGGGKRKIVADNFEGGTVSAVFGGFELDLRKANMAGDSAVLQVDAAFGGIEVRIPENWSAVVQGTGIFGGYSDESTHPNERDPGVKHLIVKGGAVFGGVVVKN